MTGRLAFFWKVAPQGRPFVLLLARAPRPGGGPDFDCSDMKKGVFYRGSDREPEAFTRTHPCGCGRPLQGGKNGPPIYRLPRISQ